MARTIEVTIRNPVGLHARPAAIFVKNAARFSSKIQITNLATRSAPANAKSILGVLSAGVRQDHRLLISADGPDEEQALAALESLIESNFAE